MYVQIVLAVPVFLLPWVKIEAASCYSCLRSTCIYMYIYISVYLCVRADCPGSACLASSWVMIQAATRCSNLRSM